MRHNDQHTFLLEGEILGQMSTLMVATEHEQSRRVHDFQSPQIQNTLQYSKHINTVCVYSAAIDILRRFKHLKQSKIRKFSHNAVTLWKMRVRKYSTDTYK